MSTGIERALAAATDWLVHQEAPEAAIAAHETGRAESPEGARRWVRWIVDRERDGTWNGDLLATASALLTIRELREAAGLKEQDPAIGRALDWLRRQRGGPGAWTDGCTPSRHRQGFCHHFATGFYDPGPAVSAVELPSGARPVGPAEARLAISCEALRCMLLWRAPSTDDRLHLEALRRLVRRWPEQVPEGLTTTALLAAVRALTCSEAGPDRDTAAVGLEIAAMRQRGDGSWLDADPFHAIGVFHEAAAAGVGGDRVATALDHGGRLLAAAQRSDGSWGPEHGTRRALIALRVLTHCRSG